MSKDVNYLSSTLSKCYVVKNTKTTTDIPIPLKFIAKPVKFAVIMTSQFIGHIPFILSIRYTEEIFN
jgi:hypothetical protein